MSCEGWKRIKLGDIANVKGGKRLPKGVNLLSYPTGHPYIRVRDVGKNKTIELNNNFEYLDIKTQKTIKRYIVDKDDLILSIVGSIGLIGMVGETLDKANLTENCVKLTEIKIDKNYLYYFLKSKIGQNEINKGTVGAVQAKLPIKNIQNIELYSPPILEQIRIASILSSLDDKVEINNQINANLEQQAQAIFKSWFIDFEPFKDVGFVESTLGLIPKGWKVGCINDLIEKSISGAWGKEVSTDNYNQEVFCIRGADITEVVKGNIGKMPTRYIPTKNFDSKQLGENNLVIEISGGSPTQSTGRIALVSKQLLERFNKPMICTNFCKALKPKENCSYFVFYLWQYLYQQNVMFSYENGTTGIKNLNINSLTNNEQTVIPSEKIISDFNLLMSQISSIIFNIGLQNEKLSETRDTLLPKLMSGEIEV